MAELKAQSNINNRSRSCTEVLGEGLAVCWQTFPVAARIVMRSYQAQAMRVKMSGELKI